jgi:hypothetical protein
MTAAQGSFCRGALQELHSRPAVHALVDRRRNGFAGRRLANLSQGLSIRVEERYQEGNLWSYN